MIFCEDCRVKKNWKKPATFPYCYYYENRCEVCQQKVKCYDTPALFVKQEKTKDEIMLDTAVQNEYHEKCLAMVITYPTGPFAGTRNHGKTDELQTVFVNTEKGGVNWFATYELRVKIQEGYTKSEREKRQYDIQGRR